MIHYLFFITIQQYKKCMNVIIPSKFQRKKKLAEKPNCGSVLINNYAISQVKIIYVEITFKIRGVNMRRRWTLC